MTTPGGVPNLPMGALTIDTLASNLQDMTGDAMKTRAVGRFPSIMNESTGLDPSLDITPFGILTRIWAEVNSLIANADPADIQSPEDLPALVLQFIEGLPVIGQFVGLLEAILGTYTGDDEALLTVQEIFAPIRAVVAAIEAAAGGGDISDFFDLGSATSILGAITAPFQQLINGVTGGSTNPLTALISALTGTAATASTANTNAGTANAGVDGIIGTVWGGFLGLLSAGVPSGITRPQLQDAVVAQTDTMGGLNSTMTQVLAALGQGTPDADDFERASLGSTWTVVQTGSGTLAIPNGHDLNFSGSGNVEYVARKNDKQAATDHQSVTQVLATGIPTYPLFTPFPYGGNADWWLRMTAFTTWATRTGLRFRINSQAPYQATWFMHWVNAGTETQLSTGSITIPAAGASGVFEAGLGGNMRTYQFRLNGTPAADFTDSVDRGLGLANRWRGLGGKGASGIGTNQGTANIKQWAAQG